MRKNSSDKERVEAIVASVNQRVQLLATFILTQQPQMDSTENDVEEMWRRSMDETIMTSQHIFLSSKTIAFLHSICYNIIYKLRFHFCSVEHFLNKELMETSIKPSFFASLF